MNRFDTVRHVMALLLVATTPGAFTYWFVVHPFVPFWRRVGYRWGFVVAYGQYAVIVIVLVLLRRTYLAIDFGANVVTVTLGALFMVAGTIVQRGWRRQLKMRALYGLPELAPGRYESTLLCEGIYARVRHPRYLQIMLSLTGWALISNYLASYVVVAFGGVLLAFLIPLEERELVTRFGQAYEDYRRRVPALIPRFRFRGRS
jgi:protein-S-isoprenylcysteine O-methyltransferase Ste14